MTSHNPLRLVAIGIFLLSTYVSISVNAVAAPNDSVGGSLTILSNGTINNLNPAVQSGVQTAVAGSQLFASLLTADDKWQFHPYLADSWQESEDGRTYTFKLNKQAVFHDDKPITSDDVAFSVNAVKEYHPFGKSMYDDLESIETPDPHTITLRFSQPSPALLLKVSTPALLPILPKHVYGEGSLRTNPYNNKPIGSGPFQFVDYKPGQYLELKRFDKFFREVAKLEKITIVMVKDSNAAALAILRGDIQYAAYPPFRLSEIERLRKSPALVVGNKGYEAIGAMVSLEYNLVNEGPLQNMKVRQAISYAIDRKFITEKLQRSQTQPIYSPIHPSSPFWTDQLEPYELNIEKANKLLDEAGFTKNKDGTRFGLRIDFPPIYPDLASNVAEYMRPQLEKVGIKIELRRSPDVPTWINRVANYDYDLNIDPVYNWGDPTIGVARSYMSTNIIKGLAWANMSGYKNLQIDELLSVAAVAPDPATRKELYGEFQKIINQELPVAGIATFPSNTVHSRQLLNPPEGIWGAFAPFNDVVLIK